LSFSMRTLAEQAGVSIATPYNLFGSKREILLAVLDADLSDFQQALAALEADEIEVLFEALRLMSSFLADEPTFYRNVFVAVARDAPELRFLVSGPRYLAWKRLLRQATAAGLLADNVDLDAMAVVSSQLIAATLLEWAQGGLTLEEMDARNQYGVALMLLAICTERSRTHLERHRVHAEQALQRQWRGRLMAQLQNGELDATTRELLADQLKHIPGGTS
jgi:AcrR family transcriptional regulator